MVQSDRAKGRRFCYQGSMYRLFFNVPHKFIRIMIKDMSILGGDFENCGLCKGVEISEGGSVTNGAKGRYPEQKLNGVGTIDNRPSTDQLHHLVKKNVTCDI